VAQAILTQVVAAITAACGRQPIAGDALRDWQRGGDARVAVFSYRRDFNLLWGLSDDGTDAWEALIRDLGRHGSGEYTLVIVWDGTPADDAGGVAVSRYVTPYDWALLLSYSLYRQAAGLDGKGRPKMRILIFNAVAAQRGRSFTRDAFFGFHNVLPWIQDYRPLAGKEFLGEAALPNDRDNDSYAWLRQAVPPARRDAERLIRDLRRPECVLTTFPEGDQERLASLEILVAAWKAQFLRAGSRHDVANLIGPFLLATGLPPAVRERARALLMESAPGRRALWLLLREIGLLRERSGTEDTPALIGDDDVLGERKKARFLLIDDRYRFGYHHVLAGMIFGDDYQSGHSNETSGGKTWTYARRGIKLTCRSGADSLLNYLEELDPITNWERPRYLRLPRADILLIDLRLWEIGQTEVRQKLMNRLVGICDRLDAAALADADFQDGYRAARDIAEGKGVSELPALTLLPLLLSHIDPSLPILLFSSTHQREVIDPLNRRSNIVTLFSKPLLSGYGEARAAQGLIQDLREALRQSLRLHEARIIWKRIESAHWKGRPPFKVNDRWENGFLVKEGYNTVSTARAHDPHIPTGDADLSILLGRLYRHYILDEKYYDFSSVPYELIESALTPVEVTQRFYNPELELIDDITEEGGSRNQMARALQCLRNRKAHGHAPRPHTLCEQEDWRHASILAFLLLLDYITSASCSVPQEEGLLQGGVTDLWRHLRQHYSGELGECRHQWEPDPRKLGALNALPWLEFVLYTLVWTLKKACQEGRVPVSKDTYEILNRLYQQRLG
jgi:hypothetical protein